jgi:transposase InsO family protein
MILVNQVYKFGENRVRILWVEKQLIVVINIDENKMPFQINQNYFLADIKEGKCKLINNENEFLDCSKLPDSYATKRDELWEKLHPLLVQEPEIYYKKSRKKIIKENLSNIGLSERYIDDLFKRYWKSGKKIDSLIPMYYKCGKYKSLPEKTSKKRGRPAKYRKNVGINVDEYWLKVFTEAIKKYYYNSAKNSKIMTYEMMRKDYISKNNNLGTQFPTFEQFTYWMKKQLSVKNEISSRYSTKKYLKDFRPLLSGTSSDVVGPGTFEIDANICDVYLVSSFSRSKVIGRPILYLLMDKFSRLVTGMYIGLEENSYVGVMMALYNTSRDKKDFCRDYNLDIEYDEWPVQCLPTRLMADRGVEFIGRKIEEVVSSLGIEISNSGSYRGDMKGIVENFFSILNKNTKSLLIGSVDLNSRERGDKDYRLDAGLTIDEFSKIVIKTILFYNKSYLENYERTPEMIEDEVIPTPLNLWNWGLSNIGTQVRYSELDIQLALLPTDTALVTRNGLKFRAMYYASKDLIKAGIFDKSKNESKRLKIWYDPRNLSYIYLLNDMGRIEKCELLPRSNRYQNRIEEEYIHLIEDEKKMKYSYLDENEYNRAKLIDDIVQIVEDASNKKVPLNSSKKEALQNITENRRFEKAQLRKEEEFNNLHIKEED